MLDSPLPCTACGTVNPAQALFCFTCEQPLQVSASNTLTGLLTEDHLLKQRYRILTQIGAGGFGAVYKAADTQFGNRLVAIKEMSQRSLTPQEVAEATAAFKREALMLADLRPSSADGSVRIWEAKTGKNVFIFARHGEYGKMNTAAWSPDSLRIVSGSNNATAQVWDALTGDNLYVYRGHSNIVIIAGWSSDGKLIATGSYDHTVQVWQAP